MSTFGKITAIGFSASVVFGVSALIASQFIDLKAVGEWIGKLVSAEAQAQVNPFEGVTSITFFKSVPVKGKTIVIMTGTEFKTPDDMLASIALKRWCYTNLGTGNLTSQISLGSQTGTSTPTFFTLSDVDADEIAPWRISRQQLRDYARSHCRFG
ncbi:MAG: hypothetical protein ACSHYC_05795 [Alphaproteobacteria bacterium]